MIKVVSLAALTLLCTATTVTAQLGSGWKRQNVSYYVQDQRDINAGDGHWGSGSIYTKVGNVETFKMTKDTDNRCEARMDNNYTTGRWQFEGYFYVESFDGKTITEDVMIMQVWKQITISFARPNGGTLLRGGFPMGTNLYRKWVRINVIHDADKNDAAIYLKGDTDSVWSSTNVSRNDGGDAFYHKYGVYNEAKFRPVVKWRDVKIFKDGKFPAK
jgi:hypothetical protein